MRDYVSIKDVVRANLLVLDDPRANGEAFNVGGGKSFTVKEFCSIVARVFEKEHLAPQIPGLFRFGDTRHSVSDISKLRSLGWEPQFTPEESVRAYRDYLEEQTDIEDILEYAQERMQSLNVVRTASKKEVG
jgi:dTDP-L-rhamnose 4-epimerase